MPMPTWLDWRGLHVALLPKGLLFAWPLPFNGRWDLHVQLRPWVGRRSVRSAALPKQLQRPRQVHGGGHLRLRRRVGRQRLRAAFLLWRVCARRVRQRKQ